MLIHKELFMTHKKSRSFISSFPSAKITSQKMILCVYIYVSIKENEKLHNIEFQMSLGRERKKCVSNPIGNEFLNHCLTFSNHWIKAIDNQRKILNFIVNYQSCNRFIIQI